MDSESPMTTQSELDNTKTLPVAGAGRAMSSARLRRGMIIAAIALATMLVMGFIVLVVATKAFVASDRIAPGVTIAGVDVSGMTRDEALNTLRTRWVPALPDSVTVTFPGGEWKADRDELGVSLRLEPAVAAALRVGREGGLLAQMAARLSPTPTDISVEVTIDEDTLEDAVGGLAEIVDRDPVDADITVVGDQVKIIPGEVGRSLDVEATMQAIREALVDPTASKVAAVVATRKPSVTAEDLAHIEVVLGEYSTPYNPNRRDRTHNLKLAAAKLNETVLQPGEEFSFNETVGERAVEAGWREAPIFINGEVRPSTGGGICQIASTTYNAALLANLDMIERHHHSRPVDYVPIGRDATVYWGQYDLRFRNNLKHPILLLATVGPSQVTIRVLGSREDDADVEITRVGLTRVPYDTKEIEDPELEEGKREVEKKGRDGWRVTVYRKATRNGEVIRDEKLHTDYYPPQTEIVRVGTKPRELPPEEGTEATTPASPDTGATEELPQTPPAPEAVSSDGG